MWAHPLSWDIRAISIFTNLHSRLGGLFGLFTEILLLLLMPTQSQNQTLSPQKLYTLITSGKRGLSSPIQVIDGSLKIDRSQMRSCSSNVLILMSRARDECHILLFMIRSMKTKTLGRALRSELLYFINDCNFLIKCWLRLDPKIQPTVTGVSRPWFMKVGFYQRYTWKYLSSNCQVDWLDSSVAQD